MTEDSNFLPNRIGNDQSSKCVIVFVNGLGGGRNTWNEMSNYLKNNWDFEFTFDLKYYHPYNDSSNIHSFFETLNRKTKLGKYFLFLYRVLIGEDISKLSNGLSSYIEMNCFNYEKIMLVGHSMGGLISRKMINSELEKSHSVIINKLLTYATPHLGSKFAAFLGFTIQIRQMNYFSSGFLVDLNEDWNNLSAQNHVNPTYVVATKDAIVNNLSASGVDDNPHIVYAIGQSHSSLIKPMNIDDIGYATLVKSVIETFIESELSPTGGIEDFSIDDDIDFYENETSGLPTDDDL